jgi:pimeloyl-ACP methyl ester carboxylesterase
MPAEECTVDNNGVRISYYKVNESPNTIPIVIIPGAVNSAEEVMDLFSEYLPDYHIIISIRGRGKSESPDAHYTLTDQSSDILAVVNNELLSKYVLFGHSLGGTIATSAASKDAASVRGLILGDFPPFYPPYSEQWANRVLQFDGIQITKKAVEGIVHDAEYIDLTAELNSLKCPIVALRATKEDAQITLEDVEGFSHVCPQVRIIEIADTGHEMLDENPSLVASLLQEFIRELK